MITRFQCQQSCSIIVWAIISSLFSELTILDGLIHLGYIAVKRG